MTIAIVLAGFVFGYFLQHARVNRNDVITGMAVMEDWTVAKVMGLAVGVGAPLIAVMVQLGLADYHVKPVMTGGLIWGGLLFGFGMAVLGYCPGTLTVSAGQGAVDAWVGIAGGLLGGLTFTLMYPTILPLLGPDHGPISLYSQIGHFTPVYLAFTVAVGAIVVYCVFAVDRREGGTDRKWVVSGIGLALLNAALLLDVSAGRPLGASTSYPYAADAISGVTDNAYFSNIQTSGRWELLFLVGAGLAGLVFALLRKDFELRLVHTRWRRHKGDSPWRRVAWSSIGGFVLIFGARMAGGCTSGLILSGGMQLARSGLIFAAFTFASFILTGKLFYGHPVDRESSTVPETAL
jgi:hypothetical protein